MENSDFNLCQFNEIIKVYLMQVVHKQTIIIGFAFENFVYQRLNLFLLVDKYNILAKSMTCKEKFYFNQTKIKIVSLELIAN